MTLVPRDGRRLRIAIVKLRGFVHDAGGEVVESVPGLIKVRLGGRKGNPSGPFSWLGLRRSSGPIDVELHLHHLDPTKDMHMHEGTLTFIDDDHIEFKGVAWEGGKPSETHCAQMKLVRKK